MEEPHKITRGKFLKDLVITTGVFGTLGANAFALQEKDKKEIQPKTPEEIHQDFWNIIKFYDPSNTPNNDIYIDEQQPMPGWIKTAYENLDEHLNIDFIYRKKILPVFNFADREEGFEQFSRLFLKGYLTDQNILKLKELIITEFGYVNTLKTIVKEKALGYSFDERKDLDDFVNGRIDKETVFLLRELLQQLMEKNSITLTDFFPYSGNNVKGVHENSFLNLGYFPDQQTSFLEKLRESDLNHLKLGFSEQEKIYCASLKEKFFPLLDQKRKDLKEYALHVQEIINNAGLLVHLEKQKILSEISDKEEQISKGKILFYTFMTFLVKAWEGAHSESNNGQLLGYPMFETEKFTDCSVYLFEIINTCFQNQITHEEILHRNGGWPLEQIAGYSDRFCIKPVIEKHTKIPKESENVYFIAGEHHVVLLYPDVEKGYYSSTEASTKYRAIYADDTDPANKRPRPGTGRSFYDKNKSIEQGYLCLTSDDTIEEWLRG